MDKVFEIVNGTLVKYLGDEEVVTIPSIVTEIGNGAFADNADITQVVLPDTVKKIGRCAFINCYNLESVNLEHVDEEIADGAFSNCQCLEIAELSPNLKIIGTEAFYKTAIEEIVIPGSVKSIGERAFIWCNKLEMIVLGEGCEEIEAQAFMIDNDRLKREIWIPKSLKKIGPKAFHIYSYSTYIYGSNHFYGPRNGAIYSVASKEEFRTDDRNFVVVIPTVEERKQVLCGLKDEINKLKNELTPLIEKENAVAKELNDYRKENEKILKRKFFKGRTYKYVVHKSYMLETDRNKAHRAVSAVKTKIDNIKERCKRIENCLDPAQQRIIANKIINELKAELKAKINCNLDENMYAYAFSLVDILYEIGYPYANKYEAIVLWCEENIYLVPEEKRKRDWNRAMYELGFGSNIADGLIRNINYGGALYLQQQKELQQPREVWVDINTGLPL